MNFATTRLNTMWKLVTAILICISFSVSAKCVRQTYQLFGHVTDSDGTPIPNATIKVQWSGGTSSALSKKDGSYVTTISFDTFSSQEMMGDFCESRLASVGVSIAAKGFLPVRKRASFTGLFAQTSFALGRMSNTVAP